MSTYCLVENGEIVGGPWAFDSQQIKSHLPDGATDAPSSLLPYGLVLFSYSDSFAPLGYAAPVLSNGGVDAISYPIGTIEDRQAAALLQWRDSCEIESWRGRAILASQPAQTEGPLASYQGDTLLDQVDSMAKAIMPAPMYQRYLGTTIWRRNDAQIVQLAALVGLTDAQIDEWFIAAQAFVV